MHNIAQVTFFLNGCCRFLPVFGNTMCSFGMFKYNMLMQCNHVLPGNKTPQQYPRIKNMCPFFSQTVFM